MFNKNQLGDAFDRAAKKDVAPEKSIIQVLHIDSTKYGLSKEEASRLPDKIRVEKVTFPVFDKSGMYLLEAVRCDIEAVLEEINSNEEKQRSKEDHRNIMTFVLMGGGSSGAIDNFHFLFKIIQGIRNYENKVLEESKFPVRVRVVILPHIASAARIIDEKEFKAGDDFTKNAEILAKALEIEELEVTQNIGLIGFSAGGTQVTELAPLLKDRCKFVALAEPAGMSEFPKLIYEYTVGQLINVYKKHRDKGKGVKESLRLSFNETLNSSSTITGNLRNLFDLIKDYTSPVRKKVYQRSAKTWNMENIQGETMPLKALQHDTTKKARQEIKAPVIFAPVVYAKVVNTIFNNLKEKVKKIETVDDMKRFKDENPEEFNKACTDLMREMFPGINPEEIKFEPFDSSTHSSVSEQKYWDQILDAIAESINSSASGE